MDAARLETVALYLFPKANRTWKREVARMMGVHVTTVRRWVKANEVPAGYDKALECFAARKHDLLKKNDV
jgi:transposase